MEKKQLGWKFYKYLVVILLLIICFLETRLFIFKNSVAQYKELTPASQAEYLNSAWLKVDLNILYYAAKIPLYGNHFYYPYKYSTAQLFVFFYKESKEIEIVKQEYKTRFIQGDTLVSKYSLDSNAAIHKLDSMLDFKCNKWKGVSTIIPEIDINTSFCNKNAVEELK